MNEEVSGFVAPINVIDFSKAEKEKIAATEDVLAISERLIKQNMEAYYDVLAK